MKRMLVLFLVLLSFNVAAKTRVKIDKFETKSAEGRCNTLKAWKSDLGTDLQKQFAQRFNNDRRLLVSAEGEKPEYRMTGSLRAFDQCANPNKKGASAYVAIEVRVYDAKTGAMAFSYSNNVNVTGEAAGTSDFNSAQFKGSALGQAAQSSIYDLAYRVEQNLVSRKSVVHIVSKSRKVAAADYKVKLVKKDR